MKPGNRRVNAMVLIPAEKSLEDERRGFILVASSSFGGGDFLLGR
ncbi:MAG: hypothetical protein FD169_1903 [Bacillota bacterium]|nr:MAG: hypothetical protein FD169_1903 [Bacillota bacterium]